MVLWMFKALRGPLMPIKHIIFKSEANQPIRGAAVISDMYCTLADSLRYDVRFKAQTSKLS